MNIDVKVNPLCKIFTRFKKLISFYPIMVISIFVFDYNPFCQTAPYPESTMIHGITFDWSTHKEYASGADNWPITWSDDDNQYAAWGDGFGWDENISSKKSIGITRISGDKDSFSGTDVWWGDNQGNPITAWDAKTYGIISIGGILYLFAGPGSNNTSPCDFDWFELWKSTDHGEHWTKPSGALWDDDDGMILPTILNFGKDYAGARDNYMYVYANGLVTKNVPSNQVPGEIFLMRVNINNIENKSSYEYFSGTSDNPSWTSNVNHKTSVFSDVSGGVGWCTSGVQYFPDIDRYILLTTHTQPNNGRLGIFEAPEPWGPWSKIYYDRFSPSGDGSKSFFYCISPKWIWNGTSFVMIFSGTGGDDSWNSIEASFTMTPTGTGSSGGSMPEQFDLKQNYPNPFNPTTTINYNLAKSSKTTLSIYNTVGEKIRTLVDNFQSAGLKSVMWDGRNDRGQLVGSGVYLYRLEAEEFVKTIKMIFMK